MRYEGGTRRWRTGKLCTCWVILAVAMAAASGAPAALPVGIEPAPVEIEPLPIARVIIDTRPSGLEVEVDGARYTAPARFIWPVGSRHKVNAPSPQGPLPHVKIHKFRKWSDGGDQEHVIVVPRRGLRLRAIYTTWYPLWTSCRPPDGGRIDIRPDPDDDGYYEEGTVVHLRAVPSEGYVFVGWRRGPLPIAQAIERDPVPVDGDVELQEAEAEVIPVVQNPRLRIKMKSAQSWVAVFAERLVTVTVATEPAGLKVRVDRGEYTAPVSFTWVRGTRHVLSAPTPQHGEPGVRHLYDRWSDGGRRTHRIIAGQHRSYTAFYDTQYQLTVAAEPPEGGRIRVDPPSPSSAMWYPAGTVVALTAIANEGFRFHHWRVNDAESLSDDPVLRLEMDGPKDVVAVFIACIVEVTIDTRPTGLKVRVDRGEYTAPATFRWPCGSVHKLSAPSPQSSNEGVRHIFREWSDGGKQTHRIIADESETITAAYSTFYRLTVASEPPEGGRIHVEPPSPADPMWYPAGTVVRLTALPNIGFAFDHWRVNGDRVPPDPAGVAPNVLRLEMDGPKDVVAVFTRCTVEVTIDTRPTGLKVRVDRGEYTAPATFEWPCRSRHRLQAPSPQDGLEGERFIFREWSDGGEQSHWIVADESETITAAYRTEYLLMVRSQPPDGGRVRVQPPPSATNDHWYPAGTIVTLTAHPNVGFRFSHWIVSEHIVPTDIEPDDVAASVLRLRMDEPKRVIAVFVACRVRVTIDTRPTGLKVRVDRGEYTAPVRFDWPCRSEHVLSAPSPQSPAEGVKHIFREWSDGGEQTHRIIADRSETITAAYATLYRLTVASEPPEGGRVRVEPPSPTLPMWYPAGTVVELAAIPHQGYRFDHWRINSPDPSPETDDELRLEMDGPKDVVAVFVRLTKVIAARPARIDFQCVSVGESATDHFFIVNVGTAPVTIESIQSSSECFAVLLPEQEPPWVLPVGGFLRVGVAFAPDEARRYEEAIKISGDAENCPLEVPVIGAGCDGVEPVEPAPALAPKPR